MASIDDTLGSFLTAESAFTLPRGRVEAFVVVLSETVNEVELVFGMIRKNIGDFLRSCLAAN